MVKSKKQIVLETYDVHFPYPESTHRNDQTFYIPETFMPIIFFFFFFHPIVEGNSRKKIQ